MAPQSAHCTVKVPLCTICGRSPQNGQGLSIGTNVSCSTTSLHERAYGQYVSIGDARPGAQMARRRRRR